VDESVGMIIFRPEQARQRMFDKVFIKFSSFFWVDDKSREAQQLFVHPQGHLFFFHVH
jgi:hypothetical protein